MTEPAAVTAAWQALHAHRAAHAATSLRQRFAEDPRRFERHSLALDDLLLDVSKTALTDATLTLLVRLAEATGVAARRDAMVAGARINTTEDRAVLHVALRQRAKEPIAVDGRDVMPD
ncbi:MAG: glucose-6-phosphate isomerase, partial [Alphaproteobacteria bacterium]|nr:glucose-6-phosphate isomerase [Alphaproteobacteria bacterium]